MLHPLGLLLLAPKAIPLAPLFGKPRVAVEGKLGRGKAGLAGRIGGVPRQTVQYDDLEVEYVNGRVRSIVRDFDGPDLEWNAALALSGYPAKGIKAENPGERETGGTMVNDWRLSGPSLGKDFEAVYTRRRVGAKTLAQSLSVSAPYSTVVEPSPTERKAILDALRPSVERAFHGQKIRFVVHMVASANGWAFLTTTPIAAAGGKLDLKNSDFAVAAENGAAGDSAYALLQKVGGAWRPVETALLPTDVAWETWSDKHHAPPIIFPDFAP